MGEEAKKDKEHICIQESPARMSELKQDQEVTHMEGLEGEATMVQLRELEL